MEVENRRYFVRKHGLSLKAWRVMTVLRFGLTAFKGLRSQQSRQRAKGNLLGMFKHSDAGASPHTPAGGNRPQTREF